MQSKSGFYSKLEYAEISMDNFLKCIVINLLATLLYKDKADINTLIMHSKKPERTTLDLHMGDFAKCM